MSSYAIDGFTTSMLEVFNIEGWFNSTMVPGGSPFQLNTDTVNVLMPGIASYYGSHLPVDVYFKVNSLGDFTVK